MEKNYIKSSHSELKSKLMEERLEASPVDKHKSLHGEIN